ncbi:hypothetical protein GCM10011391_13720 [Pullulanibacillus camelliae]|uniref:Flagellar protein FlgN n=1 Tax=Pullulanibacillus camelliae TaxID=1707096 RepID=A0A8J2VPC1_9BACL|nr:flagellar protein FlgN [Pullulanibacillus camelliae]GGE36171.1 hypothetical protein GCM10011391_13720 [Pullulanibacillus camelliae]
MINTLIPIIENMIALHRQFNQLAIEKTDVIKDGNIKRLDKIINKEEGLARQLEQLEKQRLQIISDFQGSEQTDVGFSALIEQAPEDVQPTLQALQEQLTKEVFLLKQQNDLNQELLKQSLAWVNMNLNLLDPGSKPATYGHPGTTAKPQQPTARSRFDSKA